MRFTCNQKDLDNALNIVLNAIPNVTTKEILKNILIDAKQDHVVLTANDLKMGIEIILKANVEEIGSCTIQGSLINNIVKKLPNDNVLLNTVDETSIEIKCKKSKFNIIKQNAELYPELPLVDTAIGCKIENSLFNNMIRQTNFATSTEETKLVLTGVLMEIKNKKLNMVALDGYRLAIRESFIDTELDKTVVVPSKTLKEVSKVLAKNADEKYLDIYYTDKHIMFSIGTVKIVSRLLEGEFINYAQIIPSEHKSQLVVNTKDLLRSIERAALISSIGSNNYIKFNIDDKILRITSDVERGSIDEQIAIELEGNDLTIGFNPKYLIDALKVIDSEKIYMNFTTNVSPCIIKPVDHNNYTYLILPVRTVN